MSNTDITKYPEADAKDIITKLYKAGISAVPGIGGPFNELMSLVTVTSLEIRRKKWFENIARGLIDVQKKLKNFEFEKLHENDNFVTAFMHASISALKNHQKEKLDALRNAVLNSTIINATNEDLHIVFINMIDTMTPWHIRYLKFCDEPEKWYKEKSISINREEYYRIENSIKLFPELFEQEGFFELIVKDLGNKELLEAGSIVTNLGKLFLEYICSPI